MKHTELIIIMDRSGSMENIKSDAQGGVNSLIKAQREDEGTTNITLVQFDTVIETVYQSVDCRENIEYKLDPRGGTALLDAIGQTLTEQVFKVAGRRPDNVIVSIFTDGEENSSRTFSKERVQQLIKQAEEAGWKFLWQAANLDAVQLARDMGSRSIFTNSVQANAAGMAGTTAYSAVATRSLKAGLGDAQVAAFAATASASAVAEVSE